MGGNKVGDFPSGNINSFNDKADSGYNLVMIDDFFLRKLVPHLLNVNMVLWFCLSCLHN